jgi:GTP-binding protein
MSQVDVNPPHFKMFVNKSDYFHFSYFRYVENKLREIFGFAGTSVQIDTVDRKSIYQK